MKRRITHLGVLSGGFLFIWLFVLSSGWASDVHSAPQSGRKIAFEDLPKLVSEKNENVAAAKLHMSAQKDRTGRLARSFLPQLSAMAGDEQFKTGSDEAKTQEYWKIEASVNLYRGGRDKLEDGIRDSAFNLSKDGYVAEYRKELKEAKQFYWKVVSFNQLIADKTDALARNEQSLKAAKRRAGVGLTTNADASQFELNRISLERDLSRLELEKDMALNQLSVALAIEDHKTIEVASEFPKVAKSDIKTVDKAPDAFLAVRMQKNLEEIETLKSKQSSRWWLPKVDLYSYYGLPSLTEEYDRGLQKRNQWAAGVRVTLDLGQGFEDRAESSARNAEAEAFRRRSAHAVREGLAASHDLNHDMGVIGQMIQTADQDVQAAQNFLKLTENEYNRGVKNGPDLLEAIQKYFEFRERRIVYYRDYYLSKAEQESLMAEDQPL